MESPRITPEPGEAECKAILEALGAEEAERAPTSRWAETLLPSREREENEP